jgi:hypothetical protein
MGSEIMANYLEILADGALSIEDDAAFDFTDDVELRFDLQTDTWFNAGSAQRVFDRWDSGNAQRVVRIYFHTGSDQLRIDFGDGAGAFRNTLQLTLSPAPVDGARTQFRVQIDADNGSTETEVTVFTRVGSDIADLESDDNWTQVGNNSTAGVQAWVAADDPLWVMSAWNDATGQNFLGRLYRIVAWTDLTTTTKFIDLDLTNSANQTTAGDETEWNDGASSNTWDAQGTENTDWRYVYVKLDNLVDPLSLYGFDSDAIDLQPFRGKALGTH